MARTVEEHREAIGRLVAGIPRRTARLAVSGEAMRARPDAYAGRVASADVTSPLDLPPFTNSQMDGYAVRASDLAGASVDEPVALPAGDPVPAGTAPSPLAPGAAVAVMTGAPLPAGADAVVPVEDVAPPGFREPGEPVAFTAAVASGSFVREAASDVAAGTVLLAAGTRLGAAHWGLAAAAGVTAVDVVARPRVLVVSTGLELAPAGSPLAAGRIHDANSVSLALALREAGADVAVETVASDDARLLTERLSGHPEADLVVTTGGVSAGAYEVVRDALGPLGVVFGSVAMQPGGPQGLGVARLAGRDVPVVAFPGNPVSALVSFELLLRPALARATGAVSPDRPRQRARLADALDSPVAKHQVRRGRLAGGTVELVGGPGSHLLAGYAASDVLVHVPVGVEHLDTGDEVETWRIDG